jgi:Arm DNA-binding domain
MGKRNGVLLTKKIVEGAQARVKRYQLWDSEVTGFALRVEPSGARTFVARYRADGGGRSAIQRLVTIGRFGVLTVEQARKQAKAILGGVALGNDPAEEVREKRRRMKMAALIDLYEAEAASSSVASARGKP